MSGFVDGAACLACGDTCASGEFCCAEGNGCTELGTTDHCADCGDACNPDIADVCFDDAYCACGVNGATTWSPLPLGYGNMSRA